MRGCGDWSQMAAGRAVTNQRSHSSAQPDNPTSPTSMLSDLVQAPCVRSCLFLFVFLSVASGSAGPGLGPGLGPARARPGPSPGPGPGPGPASTRAQPYAQLAQPPRSPTSPTDMLSDLVHASRVPLCLFLVIF